MAFHLKDDPNRSYDEFHIAERLRMNGWVVPAYTLAKSNEVRRGRAGTPVQPAFLAMVKVGVG